MRFKVYDEEEEESLEDTVNAAFRQMEDKQCEIALRSKGIPEDRFTDMVLHLKKKRYSFGRNKKSAVVRLESESTIAGFG